MEKKIQHVYAQVLALYKTFENKWNCIFIET